MKNTTSLLSLLLSLGGLLIACNANHMLNCNDDETASQIGARNGNLEMVKQQLDKYNVNKNAHCDRHDTALIEAVKKGHLEVVRYLLEDIGVDPNIPDKNNYMYTRYIKRKKRVDIPPDMKIAFWQLSFHPDFCSKSFPKYAYKEETIPERYGKTCGYTPLHWAARYNHASIAKLLLEKGAQIDNKTKDGSTPLHWAAENGQTAMAGLLLDKGADPNIRNDDGEKPFDPGNSKFSPEATFLLVAGVGNIELVKQLLSKGVDINTQDKRNGDTALIRAACNGHLTLVEELIRRYANLNRRNEKKETALIVATDHGHEAIALALIKAGAYLDFKDNDGWSALKNARYYGHANIRDELLSSGAKEYLLRKKVIKYLPGVAKGAAKAGAAVASML